MQAATLVDQSHCPCRVEEGILCGDAGDTESALLGRLQRELEDDDTFEPTPEHMAALEA